MGFNEDPFTLLCFSELFTAGSLVDLKNIEGRGNQGRLQVSGGAKVEQGTSHRSWLTTEHAYLNSVRLSVIRLAWSTFERAKASPEPIRNIAICGGRLRVPGTPYIIPKDQRVNGASQQIWRIQRVQVDVASLPLSLRSSKGPNREIEPQSLGRGRDPAT